MQVVNKINIFFIVLCLFVSGKIAAQDKKCTDCHVITSKPVVHAPVEDCVACHLSNETAHPSNTKNFRFASAFPVSNYAVANKDTFALCFSCHESSIMTNEVNESTGFRNGTKSLHYVHMNGSKARSCRLCHEMHSSNNKFLIKEKLVFGDWKMPIKFTPTEKGGQCKTACHEVKKYER